MPDRAKRGRAVVRSNALLAIAASKRQTLEEAQERRRALLERGVVIRVPFAQRDKRHTSRRCPMLGATKREGPAVSEQVVSEWYDAEALELSNPDFVEDVGDSIEDDGLSVVEEIGVRASIESLEEQREGLRERFAHGRF
jgi:hypothetical protein